ncbi:cytochrome P450 [Mycobacterium sp.]|uniref:cytochrome P450 n=1 Tax=Mycobacterium sp. TaxID=1785 RepID=UPI003BB099D5
MEKLERYDPRLAPLTRQVEHMENPQTLYYDKARNIRAERVDGALTLYCHKDLIEINRHPAVLGVGGRGGFFGNDNPLIPIEVDGDDHKKWRKLLDPLFAPKQVQQFETSIRTLSRDLIGKFLPTGTAELHDDLCVPLPCLTFLRIIGAPAEDLPYFLTFKDVVLHPKGDTIEEIGAEMASAGAKFVEYMKNLIERRRAETEPADDVLAVLLRSTVDGRPVSDAEVHNIMYLLMFAGLDTVTSSLSCILGWLGEHPAERRRLVQDPSVIPAAIEELMRYESPVPFGVRFATDEIDLGDGLVVQNGDAIHTLWAAANVDESEFPDPLVVDFDRGRTNHIAFASGTHRCLGSHLARLELRAAVDEFLQLLPEYEVTEPIVYSNTANRVATHVAITFPA